LASPALVTLPAATDDAFEATAGLSSSSQPPLFIRPMHSARLPGISPATGDCPPDLLIGIAPAPLMFMVGDVVAFAAPARKKINCPSRRDGGAGESVNVNASAVPPARAQLNLPSCICPTEMESVLAEPFPKPVNLKEFIGRFAVAEPCPSRVRQLPKPLLAM